MGQKTRILCIERKAGHFTGPARIERVTYSKTGATIYYSAKGFSPHLLFEGRVSDRMAPTGCVALAH